MPEDKKPVQITITASAHHADRNIVARIVSALTDVLDEPENSNDIEATIVTKIKKSAG